MAIERISENAVGYSEVAHELIARRSGGQQPQIVKRYPRTEGPKVIYEHKCRGLVQLIPVGFIAFYY